MTQTLSKNGMAGMRIAGHYSLGGTPSRWTASIRQRRHALAQNQPVFPIFATPFAGFRL